MKPRTDRRQEEEREPERKGAAEQRGESDPKRRHPDAVQMEIGERTGSEQREPEEPHGESEAV